MSVSEPQIRKVNYDGALLLCLVIAFFSFRLGYLSTKESEEIKANGHSAIGTVISTQKINITVKQYYWLSEVEFTAEDKLYVVEVSSLSPQSVGTKINLYYLPDNPKQFTVDGGKLPSGWIGYAIGFISLVPAMFFLIARVLDYLSSLH